MHTDVLLGADVYADIIHPDPTINKGVSNLLVSYFQLSCLGSKISTEAPYQDNHYRLMLLSTLEHMDTTLENFEKLKNSCFLVTPVDDRCEEIHKLGKKYTTTRNYYFCMNGRQILYP